MNENKRGTKPSKTGVSTPPIPPPWLNADALEVFLATSQLLVDGSGVAQVDGDLLAAYSVAVIELREADRALAGAERYYPGPNGAICSHPAIRDRRQSMAAIAHLSGSLGIGATARKRNRAEAAPPPGADPLAEYQND